MPIAVRRLVAVAGVALAASASVGSYSVRKGDTLERIASANHTTVSALITANAIRNPNLITIGQSLRIPASAAKLAPAAAPPPAKAGPPVDPGHHIVTAGETVASVAKQLGLSPVALAAANGATNNVLYIGARITIAVSKAGQPPQPAFPFIAQAIHVVAKGETLARIAKAGGVPLATLASANGLAPSAKLAAGTRIIYPTWLCPVAGPRTFVNDWGFPRSGPSWHEGIDIMAKRGTPVVAPVAGVLQRSPNNLGGNAFQLVGDDGIRYYGAHLDRYGAQGRVKAGTVIGYVGNTGDAAGGPTHLHFEIHPGSGPAVPPYPTISLACR